MEPKTEIKTRYYFLNKSTNPKIIDFTLSISHFEEILKSYLESNTGIEPVKNSYKLYGINNKYFKVFLDGSCFGYTIKNSEFKIHPNMIEQKIIQQQIYNDEFPGLKVYWVEEFHEEIIFKLDDCHHLVFCKSNDIPRNIQQYSIFLDIKKETTLTKINSHCTPITNLFMLTSS